VASFADGRSTLLGHTDTQSWQAVQCLFILRKFCELPVRAALGGYRERIQTLLLKKTRILLNNAFPMLPNPNHGNNSFLTHQPIDDDAHEVY
jgi:hypothetical protein